jgi:predicted nuclease of predicted toxin-antitoxin system
MKLVLDNNLSYKLCKPLQKHFSIAEHVKSVLSLNAEDIVIWTFAKEMTILF